MTRKQTIVSLSIKSVLVIVAFIGIIKGLVETGPRVFLFFTQLSNVFIALVSLVLISFDINKLTKENKTIPNWLNYVKFSATIGITLTFVVFWVLLAKDESASYLRSFNNLSLHTIVPILAITEYVLFTKDFGYPITPQNEVPEYLSKHMKNGNQVFLQAESEVAAINMVYGAAASGKRVMTSSSSPGIALKQEGISYLAGAELPAVIVNVMRAGPGLGGIQPAQADYNQITRGGGNGDYHILSYAPENLQEMVDIIQESFYKADYYRNPVMIAVDGLIGQMMESVSITDKAPKEIAKPWATNGKKDGEKRLVNSLYLDANELEIHNNNLALKYQEMIDKEIMFEEVNTNDSEVILVAYGTMARICRSAIEILEKEGIKVGLIRPITLWPFVQTAFEKEHKNLKFYLTCELSMGQMVHDVKLKVNGKKPVKFFGRSGGNIPEPNEIVEAVKEYLQEVKK